MRPNPWYALSLALLATLACSGGTTEPDGTEGRNGEENRKIFTATINGAPFAGTTVTGAWLAGNLVVAGQTAGRTIHISAINASGPGTITFGIGNQWSALAQVIDNTTGQFSTGYGGSGSLILEIATLSRIKGSFSFIAYTGSGGGLGQPVVTVQNGAFDVTIP